ncbi:MAG: TIGR02757 family protein [Acetomicrobium sp.]
MYAFKFLESLYEKYNNLSKAQEDPVRFLHCFNDIRAREIVGIVSSSLAFGRVSQIIDSVGKIISILGDDPVGFVAKTSAETLMARLDGFKHRWVGGCEIAGLLYSCKTLIERYGSLEGLYESCMNKHKDPLAGFATAFRSESFCDISALVPDLSKKSPCKRLRLFVKWMVRSDNVDPGGWTVETPSNLVVPLDVHMWKIGKELGWIKRSTPDVKAALELTEAFKTIRPDDPLRYDFALSHVGMEGRGYDVVLLNLKR